MRTNLNIVVTEKDIFNFVFFPDSLSEEKKNLLLSDDSFSEPISFYQNMKAEISKPIDYKTKKLIADKISAYSLPKLVKLIQLKTASPLRKKPSRFAADSEYVLKPKIVTKTFVDEDKDFLVKILQNGNQSKIFVFSTNDEIIENFSILLEPQKLEFHLKDNSEPLIIDGSIDVEAVNIYFNE